MNLLDLAML